MMQSSPYMLDGMLPWDHLPSDAERQRRITIIMLLLALLFTIVIPFIKVPKEDRKTAEALPERIARVVERKVEPPPPPPPPKEELKKEEPKPAEKPKEKPKPTEVEKAKARETASKALKDTGIDQLQSLREAFDVPMSGPLITDTKEAGTSRAMLTSRAGSGSNALASGGYGGPQSTGFGGGKAGGKGYMGDGAKLQGVESGIKGAATASGPVNKDGKSRRTAEEIRKVFDQNGGRLNNLYQRALRDDPSLEGSITLKLTIAPDGSVTSCSVVSNQIGNDELASKIAAAVRGFNFGQANVEVWSGNHTLNFFPG
ncbi:MAG: AgmX/PglI C-terminal domain-containing protein [Moraxellaceae bacterium]|nr:AgmX/PglI C-terminal domain-containing protein [Moraxellaceae bacterium]